MASPVVLPKKTFFYPVGNTTPTCFTQDLAPEVNANVLLLACGDPRSILYTIHTQVKTIERRLDFTCCDWEPAVLARNTLLFTMIMDGVEPTIMWSTFYHFFLDQPGYDILISQCRTLIKSSVNLGVWRKSKYGSFLRFCTDHSLAEIRRHWVMYVEMAELPRDELNALKASFRSGMKSTLASLQMRPNFSPATGPLIFSFFEKVASKDRSYTEIWTTGVTSSELFNLTECKFLNPTFAHCQSGRAFKVHYGTNPIAASFLAPALTPTKDQPLVSQVSLKDLVKVSMTQFSTWCSSFKARIADQPHNTVIRIFTGDALAFCHALRYLNEDGVTSTGVYAYPWGGTQVNFNAEDYGARVSAPILFNVIDTSNLTDHSGLLNILAVTIPLLLESPSSAIHTNTLLPSVGRGDSTLISSGLSVMACADIPTLSVLLGVAPTFHTSHFNSISNKHHILGSRANTGQFLEPISWKKVSSIIPGSSNKERLWVPSLLDCNPKMLGQFLLSLYLKIFDDENVKAGILNFNYHMLRKVNLVNYTRASFASLLEVMKRRVATDWRKTIRHFLDVLEVDTTLLMNLHSYQELRCQLHFRGLYPIDNIVPPSMSGQESLRNRLREWGSIPSVVCVVLKVPRRYLQILEDMDDDKVGTPPMQCETSSATFHNLHVDFRPIFGDIKVSRASGEDHVEIIEDIQGFRGHSPLIVSFYLPSVLALLGPPVDIGLHLRTTPDATIFFAELGMGLTIFSAPLTDREHIHIVRHRPSNPAESARIRSRTRAATKVLSTPARTVLAFDTACASVKSLTIKDSITDAQEAESLADGAPVTTQAIADGSVLVTYRGYRRIFTFPYPVKGNQCKMRIARKSSYIEIECPIRSSFEDSIDLSTNPFPAARDGNQLINLLNLHYLNLNILPALHLPNSTAMITKKIEWMIIHLRMSLSEREKVLQPSENHKRRVLADVKESITKIFLGATGSMTQSKEKAEVFGLHNPQRGIGVYTLIFVNDVKLDLAGHTIAVDACVIPLTEQLASKVGPLLSQLQQRGMLSVNTEDDEVCLWKLLLPVFAERCRTWQHTSSCEYLAKGFPASLNGYTESPLCSCGKGKDLGVFGTQARWESLHREATRIAIGPLFTTSFVSPEDQKRNPSSARTPATKTEPRNQGANKCANCGGPGKPNLLVCSVCKKIKYCSRVCQTLHWKTHNSLCTKTN